MEYVKYIDKKHIKYPPTNYNFISNYDKNIPLLIKDGYKPLYIIKKNKTDNYNLSYYLHDDRIECIYEDVINDISFDELKNNKLKELEIYKNNQLKKFIKYDNDYFDLQNSINMCLMKIKIIEFENLENISFIGLYYNHMFDIENLYCLLNVLNEELDIIYKNYYQILENINNSKNIDDLMKISIDI